MYFHFTYMIHSGNGEELLPHEGVWKLETHHAGGRLFATVSREDRMGGGHLQLAVLHGVVVVLHRVDKAFGSVLVMLQDGALVPGLVDGRLVIVTEFPVRFHFHLPEDKLPASEAAHCGYKPKVGAEALDQPLFLLVFETPLAVTGIGHLGVEN